MRKPFNAESVIENMPYDGHYDTMSLPNLIASLYLNWKIISLTVNKLYIQTNVNFHAI